MSRPVSRENRSGVVAGPPTRLAFAYRDSEHWREAWGALIKRAGHDPDAEVCECCGEGWQYMGSVQKQDGGKWVAQFRHRHYPYTGQRMYSELRMETAPEGEVFA